jgi:hypothetical protein
MRQHDVIKTADWVIDLGPGGGVNGGEIVATGTPDAIAAEPKSFTGAYLAPLLSRSSRAQSRDADEDHAGPDCGEVSAIDSASLITGLWQPS